MIELLRKTIRGAPGALGLGLVLATAVSLVALLRRKRKPRPMFQVDGVEVYLAETNSDADLLVEALGFESEPAIGLDCEWPPSSRAKGGAGGDSSRVAVVQIASARFCLVTRLTEPTLPPALARVLSSPSTVKVGVEVANDALKLSRDFGGSFGPLRDLRELARGQCGYSDRRDGLAALSRCFASSSLPHKTEVSVRCSRWDLPLSTKQLAYAAGDAIASFAVLHGIYESSKSPDDNLQSWLLRPASSTTSASRRRSRDGEELVAKKKQKSQETTKERAAYKRERRERYETSHLHTSKKTKKMLYDNIELRCEGKILGLVNGHKADWYVAKGMATRFEGHVELGYRPETLPVAAEEEIEDNPVIWRKNECVSCGTEDRALTRFYVVPYGYRRCFPTELKAYSSHDIVALCLDCRERVEPVYRHEERRIASERGVFKQPTLREETTRARALRAAATLGRRDVSKIPEHRRSELETLVKAEFGALQSTETVQRLVAEEKALVKKKHDEKEVSEYELVVRAVLSETESEMALQVFQVGWRRLFVQVLQPTHLPLGWEVEHEHQPRARPDPLITDCRAFLNGKCTWGQECRYRHAEEA